MSSLLNRSYYLVTLSMDFREISYSQKVVQDFQSRGDSETPMK